MRKDLKDSHESNLNNYERVDSSDNKGKEADSLVLYYWRQDIENRIFRDLLGIKSRECT